MAQTNLGVMMYMSAQNELASYADSNIEEIKACASGGRTLNGVCTYMLLDTRLPNGNGKTYQIFLKDGATDADFIRQDYKIKEVMIENKDVHTKTAFNNSLFNAQMHFSQFSPKNEVLIFWGHGGGLKMLDEGKDSEKITINDIHKVLHEWYVAQGEPMKFNIIAFDCCYMCMIETLHHLRDVTPYALCSSTPVDVSGFPYQKMFEYFSSPGCATDPKQIAQEIRSLYDDYYKDEVDRRLFLCDLDKSDICISDMNKLGMLLQKAMTSAPNRPAFNMAILAALSTAHEYHGYVNVLYLSRTLKEKLGAAGLPSGTYEEIVKQIGRLVSSVKECFEGSMGDDTDNPVSPQIWAPSSQLLFNANAKIYNALASSAGGTAGWVSFWKSFHGL